MSFPSYSPPEKNEKVYPPALSGWDPEKCSRCGKPMVRGLAIVTGSAASGLAIAPLIFEPVEKLPFVPFTHADSRRMVSQPKWYIRAYMCRDCDIWVCYGQDPKTGEMYMPHKEQTEGEDYLPSHLPYYLPTEKGTK